MRALFVLCLLTLGCAAKTSSQHTQHELNTGEFGETDKQYLCTLIYEKDKLDLPTKQMREECAMGEFRRKLWASSPRSVEYEILSKTKIGSIEKTCESVYVKKFVRARQQFVLDRAAVEHCH